MRIDEIISYLDWLLAPFYILLIYIVAYSIKKKNILKAPHYKYFVWGILAKIFGAIFLCVIYVYYYKMAGDTLSYNSDSSLMLKLLFKSPGDFLSVWLTPMSEEMYYYFTPDTGYPAYARDSNAFMVVRLLVPLRLLGLDSYLLTSILLAAFTFTGSWKLYVMFCDIYPNLYKKFAIAILFVPSVVFWGSGMLKDSWTLAAAGWYTYSFYYVFVKRTAVFTSFLALVISAVILILIKPYIFLGLLPGSLLWLSWSRISKVKNIFIRIFVAPLIVFVGLSFGFVIWSFTSSNFGEYSSIDGILKKAVEASDDLKQDYYQGNSFDLGYFEPTIGGVISKFPIATVTGLFRPFIWETRNIVMLVSGLENFIILLFTFFVLFRKPKVAFSKIFKNPLVLFCFTFAVFFAFSVAISTSNFGALVRLRIPMIPFFLCGLVLIEYGNLISGKMSRDGINSA